MSSGIPYADILILALIAGFILLRLRSVLGTRSEDDPFTRRPQAPSERPPIIRLDEKSLKSIRVKEEREDDPYLDKLQDGDVTRGLESIREKDPLFSATEFLNGARMAFEMVFDAFAKGDKQTLSMLLAPAALKEFADALDARQKEEGKTETTLVSVKAKDIDRAELAGAIARLTVQFESEQITIVRDAKGAIVEGDPSEVHYIEDEWVFERDTTSKNPNWKINET